MLIFNNLLINGNSNRYHPFLLNIVSGRRRLLSYDEAELIRKMQSAASYNDEMKRLFEQLLREKQFFTDEMRKSVEDAFETSGYWKCRSYYAKDYRFSIEITRSCNMNCFFCYASSRNKAETMTKNHIDAILSFYQKYAEDQRKIGETPFIRITGGEPLFNEESVHLIQYIADKWKKAKITLFTNGVNLLKYYDYLPLDHLGEVHISLDGTPEIHLKRRFSKSIPDESVYEKIIGGIQKLLSDKINVKVKTVVDRNNYPYIEELQQILKERGILDSPYCEHLIGITLDYYNRTDIMEEANDKQDIKKIEAHLQTLGVTYSTYPNLSILQQMLSRTENSPFLPKCSRCNSEMLANYFFSCNGRVYLCDCIEDDIGILGTFYPDAELYENAVKALYDRTILSNLKCAQCVYKYICLGGCPHGAIAKRQEMTCSVFEDEDLLDNLEFDYTMVIRQRGQEQKNEAD